MAMQDDRGPEKKRLQKTNQSFVVALKTKWGCLQESATCDDSLSFFHTQSQKSYSHSYTKDKNKKIFFDYAKKKQELAWKHTPTFCSPTQSAPKCMSFLSDYTLLTSPIFARKEDGGS